MHTKLILNLASKRNYSSSSNSSNSSLVIRSPDNQNRVVNELQLTQTQPSIQTQTQASANSDINPEQLLNSVSNNPNTKTLSLKDKGKKRPIDEVSSSEDSVVSKKVMESQNSEQSSNNALIPNSDSEQSSNNALIPNSDTNPEEIEHIQNTYITLKSQVRVAMDNIKECREIMEQYKKFEVYVCERRPSSISRNIEFDATFEKHGANYTLPDNRTGLY
jgi:hypothetical protein